MNHYGYKRYPDTLASRAAWKRRGRRVRADANPVATATRRPFGKERGSKRYDLFDISQTDEIPGKAVPPAEWETLGKQAYLRARNRSDRDWDIWLATDQKEEDD
jgi:hypothetical protein